METTARDSRLKNRGDGLKSTETEPDANSESAKSSEIVYCPCGSPMMFYYVSGAASKPRPYCSIECFKNSLGARASQLERYILSMTRNKRVLADFLVQARGLVAMAQVLDAGQIPELKREYKPRSRQ